MNIRLIALVGLTACFLFGILRARAADPAAALSATLASMDQLQGRFEQRQFSEEGELLQRSSGSFRLLRPHYFAWEIETPDSQLIIAGPQYIWHHDRDLETVTRRPVSGNADTTPLQILAGDEEVLTTRFEVNSSAPGQYLLVDRTGKAGFGELTLTLEDSVPSRMVVINKLNQRVEIDFRIDKNAPALTATDFAFEPPPGADLFYYEQ